jgi:predicted negative regulator of RcsB-dependent stress response
VDDYLSEKEQWERLKQWLAQNGVWIAAGVLVGVLGLFGWRWWQERQDRIALDAGGKYEQMLQALGRADRTRAEGIAEELRKDYASSPFVDQADLTLARAYVEAGDLAKAAERLKGVAERSRDEELKLIARLRLARVQIAQGKPDDALATLGAVQPGAFAPRYESVRGDAYLAKGDKKLALDAYRKARAGEVAGGVVDGELLDLKIGDLAPGDGSKPAAAAAAGAPAPAPAPGPAAASR